MPAEAAAEAPIRLTLLGGFLGAGKTTWLRHQLHGGVFADAQVIVNEGADEPVDDRLLGRAARLATLAGGCACCVAKARLMALLGAICASEAEPPPARIVLETSGFADPAPIVAAIDADPALAGRLVVSETVVLVDALHALAQLRGEPLVRRQVAAADCLIVSKVDLVEAADLGRLLATLRLINPAAALFGAVEGTETALPDDAGAEPEILPDAAEEAGRPPMVATTLAIDESVDWTAFTLWLSALLHARGDDIVRVKGVLRSPAGLLLVQTVRRSVQIPEIMPDDAAGSARKLVVIGRGYRAADLARSLRHFTRPKPR